MISCLTAAKSFQIRFHFPCPALAALHAQPIIRYFAVPFRRPFSFACAIHMYTPVGGKAPWVPLGASPCSPWEPQCAVPARWCGARARVCLPAVRRIVPYFAGYVAGVSVSQCCVWQLGWLGRLGSCLGAGTFCLAWRAGLGVTHPCLLAGVGVAPCGEPMVPWVPRVGFRRTGILGSVAAPLSLLDAVSFLRGVCPSYQSRRLYVLNRCQRHRRFFFPVEVRAGPRGACIP